MELLLWLWYFDNNFFFKIKSTLFIYKFSWILPIIINIILTLICLYYLHLSDTEKFIAIIVLNYGKLLKHILIVCLV